MKKKFSRTTFKQAQKKADTAFQKYIRLRDHGKPCFSCKQYAKLQAGHFIGRTHKSVRYDVTNCHGQCWHCNHALEGNLVAYERKMIETYGQIHIDHLKSMSQVTAHRKAEDLLTLEMYYNGLIKEMEK